MNVQADVDRILTTDRQTDGAWAGEIIDNVVDLFIDSLINGSPAM